MVARSIKRRITKIIAKAYDPLVDLRIGNQVIKVNLSHQLREILAIYPLYNFNLARIVGYVENQTGKCSVIDIGANVGDTVAFIRNNSDTPILCIDGEEKYVTLLRKNVQQYEKVYVCQALVGKENKEENIKLKVENGTAHVEQGANPVRVRTIQNILAEFPDFIESRILKTDTDGFDTWILRSCPEYLQMSKPILFFEFDPYFITRNGDNPWDFLEYLRQVGYRYLIFYTNIGDYLLSCDIGATEIVNQLIHYFSGRNIEMFADICAFQSEDKELFDYTIEQEIKFFKKFRGY